MVAQKVAAVASTIGKAMEEEAAVEEEATAVEEVAVAVVEWVAGKRATALTVVNVL